MKRSLYLFVFGLIISIGSFAQLRDIPAEVTDAFSKQYPGAEQVVYKDNLKNFHVHFTLAGDKYIAKYNSKGEWKESEKSTDIVKLPQPVQDGFNKSKYADWKITEVVSLLMPKDAEHYKIRVEKGELQKKNLYFNKEGRLTKDGLTF
jgi:hypothetical protein